MRQEPRTPRRRRPPPNTGTERDRRVSGASRGQVVLELAPPRPGYLPDKLRTVEKGVRALGQGEQVDQFVLSMNRAAEKAAPAAKTIFWDAITSMSFDDARRILGGGDTAATEYFRAKTGDALTAAFRPVVDDSMKDVGVVQKYDQLRGSYRSVPFASSLPSFDIEEYVVAKALDGLFLVLGQEERKIRTNPAARVTDLLKQVFGK